MTIQLPIKFSQISDIYYWKNFFWSKDNLDTKIVISNLLDKDYKFQLLLQAPEGAGSSHLLNAIADEFHPKALFLDFDKHKFDYISSVDINDYTGIIIDHLENIDKNMEVEFFYLLNQAIIEQKNILITTKSLQKKDILIDIKTRMQQLLPLTLRPLSDIEDIKQAIIENMSLFSVEISDNVLDYCLNHLSCNIKNLMLSFMQSIYQEQKISIPTIKSIYEQIYNSRTER